MMPEVGGGSIDRGVELRWVLRRTRFYYSNGFLYFKSTQADPGTRGRTCPGLSECVVFL